ncbi:protein of unknown function UPF0079 [Pirellula staleyi DSM 6068]|uniref:tRNA threonylcarbamoyladenosine biosynthesis protein TsaE n=1 Tax=Pirellula staleyi (strain ATCC 27377 / DSM 6068 / ICPB 4128) TaxID=530564 RepID=D2R1W1_PIRSD|nr:tRNA (adenosine(37)-N6)-threonylcarbamoyltransferase complex ATPase subunit type 1 TsaE [Pirellula staleyi]ADB18572.1 protein of unknown function UPF0079 [Pirellula staleyi DSM 6068]
MSKLIFHADDLEGTAALAHALAHALPAGSVVSLEGTLGAGKTQLVRLLVEALGGSADDVVSPTFVLQATYTAAKTVQHFDAYRLPTSDEFLAIGGEETLASPALSFVEWGERVSDVFPEDFYRLSIAVTGSNSREFTLESRAPEQLAVLEQLRDLLPQSQLIAT